MGNQFGLGVGFASGFIQGSRDRQKFSSEQKYRKAQLEKVQAEKQFAQDTSGLRQAKLEMEVADLRMEQKQQKQNNRMQSLVTWGKDLLPDVNTGHAGANTVGVIQNYYTRLTRQHRDLVKAIGGTDRTTASVIDFYDDSDDGKRIARAASGQMGMTLEEVQNLAPSEMLKAQRKFIKFTDMNGSPWEVKNMDRLIQGSVFGGLRDSQQKSYMANELAIEKKEIDIDVAESRKAKLDRPDKVTGDPGKVATALALDKEVGDSDYYNRATPWNKAKERVYIQQKALKNLKTPTTKLQNAFSHKVSALRNVGDLTSEQLGIANEFITDVKHKVKGLFESEKSVTKSRKALVGVEQYRTREKKDLYGAVLSPVEIKTYGKSYGDNSRDLALLFTQLQESLRTSMYQLNTAGETDNAILWEKEGQKSRADYERLSNIFTYNIALIEAMETVGSTDKEGKRMSEARAIETANKAIGRTGSELWDPDKEQAPGAKTTKKQTLGQQAILDAL
jgi:hypothetical protein